MCFCVLLYFTACMLYYCNTMGWAWWDWGLIWWLTILFQCFDTVGWVTWPVKISSPNDLYCVEWDVKPYSTQPISIPTTRQPALIFPTLYAGAILTICIRCDVCAVHPTGSVESAGLAELQQLKHPLFQKSFPDIIMWHFLTVTPTVVLAMPSLLRPL